MVTRSPRMLRALLLATLGIGCGSSAQDGGLTDMATSPPDLVPPTPNIKHVVIIVQENHTFDSYFGHYCTAPAGSNPTCTTGPACCEAAPVTEASGASPMVLDDASNGANDRNHTQACELSEINGGKMDRFVTGTGCSAAINFAIAPDSVVKPYFNYASRYALADRYFQPLVGQSSSNDMYLAVARYVFTDNDLMPNAVGHGCWNPPFTTLTRLDGKTTIADLLIQAGKGFAFYAEGYDAMKQSAICPGRPSDCTFTIPAIVPNTCIYDPSDVPFEYYAQFADNPKYMKDYTQLATDIKAGTLPEVVFVKALTYKDEHPGYGTKISFGTAFVDEVIGRVMASPYANDTLMLVTWDEGGGFYDHVAPPPNSPVDGQPYGTRIPLLAIGRFAKQNHVSHVVMEHSSIVRFLEYNFLGATGQLMARDASVNNIGSLLDGSQTGIQIPEN